MKTRKRVSRAIMAALGIGFFSSAQFTFAQQDASPQAPAQPEMTQPETAQPETAQPQMAQPETAQPQTAQAAPEQVQEKIVITGSNIPRSEAATVENVQIITPEEIKSSGQLTVADYLRTLSSTFGNSYNESFSNSYAPGAAMVGLRGLTQKDTLVLLNGRRITNYGLFQNLSDSFVDLNVIPLAAIERIEVLKSGGSAIYGSDAIAGVINIILKQNSTEKTAEIGDRITTDGGANTRDASLLLGFGDFANQGYNVTSTVSLYKRDQLLFSQRENTAAQDYRNLPDGVLWWHISNQYTSVPGPFPNCGKNGIPGQPENGTSGFGCYYNDANQLPLVPGAERANLTSTGNLRLNSDWTAFSDVFYSNEKTTQYFTPATLGPGNFVVNPATGGAAQISNVLPASNPASLGGAPTPIQYAFQSVGPRDAEVISNTYRVSGGVKGTLHGWDVEAAYGHSENHVSFEQQNGINATTLVTDINNGSFNFLNPALTPGANAALGIQYGFSSVAKLDTLGVKGTEEMFNLPGGKASTALGAEFRHESVDDEPGSAINSGVVLNEGATRVVASRDVSAVFAEFDFPFLKSLEADIAAREEHYTDVGNNFKPQTTLRWQPVREFTMRAVYAQGFRAPSLAEASNSISVAHQSVIDPLDPLHRPTETVGFITGGNPNVTPETSKNLDLGLVFSPISNANLSLDYYSIYLYHVIAPNATAQQIVSDPTAYPPGSLVRTANGTVLYAKALYTNQFEVHTAGVDVNADLSVPLPSGAKLKFALDATYVSTFQVNNGSQWSEFVGNNGWDYLSPISGGGPVPRWKGSILGAWENPDWVGQATVRYTDSYANSLTIFGLTQQEVASFTALDLYGQYRGLKNWKFSLSVVNALNQKPPYDSAFSLFGPIPTPYDFTTYDDLGRMIDFRVAYSF